MAEIRRSREQSGIIVKNRSSSGCLIVRKKNEDIGAAGSSGARKIFRSKKEKRRPRMELSDSGSSDELLMPPRRRLGPETLRVCNGLSLLEKGVVEESEFGRKRGRDRVERVGHNEDGLIGRTEELSDRKRNRLDVFEFDEYDGVDEEMMMRPKHLGDSRMDIGGRRFLGSMAFGRGGIEREFEPGSSRQVLVDKRKNLFFERTSSFNQGGMNRFGMDRDAGYVPTSLLREKYMGDSDEPIRLQGKNGVLKVMVKKKKRVEEPVNNYDCLDVEENRSSSRIEDNVKQNAPIHPPSYLETEVLEKPCSFLRKEKNKLSSRKSLSTKKCKDDNSDSGDSDTAIKLGPKRMEACKSVKEVSSENEKTPSGKLALTTIKEGKVRRGSGTEKQKLRERIRGMLVEAGWTIDYRPRRNRDYLDAVYINPSGTAYWSIIKAYDALLKQLHDEEDEPKRNVDGSPFTPLSDEVLGQLTRKTRKKIEKEMKKKQRDGSQSLSTREATSRRNLGARHDEDSMDSSNHEEKLSSFLKQGGKSAKGRMNENGVVSQSTKGQSSTHLHDIDGKPPSGSNSHTLHGRKSRKLGRCTLLVRSSNEGSNSETDGFIPYAGKRTLLSWLIDSGTVQLSEKVQYMNRRRTKVMLEGWITRDGIHCGCCSKILTVSKFEIHAGSKLRQPFQNIYLDSGVSLLQCQVDAWNRQEGSERIGFDAVDIDGDDPNDDTCGICGDGGDLICCDGCPSTFHQSCLDIETLPPGDWHCPNCTCKFCGVAGEDTGQGGNTTAGALLTCSICEKKYHKLCMQEMDALPVDSVFPFCGQKCRELFEHLQKYLGVKHELEAGFSWSLVRRTDEDSDTSLRGLPQRVECNSKLAVALTVMDECFLPIVDRRSGINLIHNILYNSGSNFNRLNYTGFYTAILERGDEIISAASIRFHGTQLAEMPFIGTRHIYRRQGMCRRLFCALEAALRSFKVEKLIIPAIAELMHTWTTVFGFTPLEESLKQEMKSLNMLVFPGIDMLQKVLLEPESINENMMASTASKQVELRDNHEIVPDMANKADIDSSAVHNSHKCASGDLLHSNGMSGEVAAADFESKFPGASSNCTSMLSGSSPSYVSNQGTSADCQSDDKMSGCSDGKSLSDSEASHNALEKETKPEEDSPKADITHSRKEGGIDVNVAASHEVEMPIFAEETASLDSQPGDKLVESAVDTSLNVLEKGNKAESDSPVESNSQLSAECDIDNAGDVTATVAVSRKAKIAVLVKESSDSQSRNKSVESASERNCHTIPTTSNDAMDIESKPIADSLVEDNVQSCEGSDVDDAHSTDVNIAAAHEVDSAVSVEGTARSDSQLEDKLLGSFCNRFSNCHNGCNKLPVESKAVSKSSVKGNAHFCKGVDTDDAHAMDVNVAITDKVEKPVSVEGLKSANSQLGDKLVEDEVQTCREGDTDEPKIPISVAGRITGDPELGDKSIGCASEKECIVSEAIDDPVPTNDPVPTKQKPSLESPPEDKSTTCKGVDSDDNFAQVVAAPLGNKTTVNKAGEDNNLQPCSDSIQNDVPEGKTESSST